MTWTRIMFEPGMKTHVVPEAMQQAALAELLQRGGKLFEADKREGLDLVQFAPIRAVDAWYLEFGGMVHKDEPDIEVDTIDGLKIEARCDHVSMIVAAMKMKNDIRFFGDGKPYRKVYAWTSCIVMTPPQFDRLLVSFERVAPEAERRAAAFHKELMARPLKVPR